MLDPQMFEWLKQKSVVERRTIGSLVRIIMEKEYERDQNQLQQNRAEWWLSLQKLRTQHSFSGRINYKALIEDGRKY